MYVCMYISVQHPHGEGVGVRIRSGPVERMVGKFCQKWLTLRANLRKTRRKLVFPDGRQSLEMVTSNVPLVRDSFPDD